jgi:hypothetical protein
VSQDKKEEEIIPVNHEAKTDFQVLFGDQPEPTHRPVNEGSKRLTKTKA